MSPIYEYVCDECGEKIEVLRSMKDHEDKVLLHNSPGKCEVGIFEPRISQSTFVMKSSVKK